MVENLDKSEIRIEKPTPDDAREMLELRYEIARSEETNRGKSYQEAREEWQVPEPEVARLALEIKNANRNDRFFVALDGHRVVGRCRITWRADERAYWFREFFVRPGYTAKGIGRMLWDEATRRLRAKYDIILRTNSQNTHAIQIYERWGFEQLDSLDASQSGLVWMKRKAQP